MRHAEKVARVTEARTVTTGAYDTIEVDYVTASGIAKTLRMPHAVADAVASAITDEISAMEPERKRRSFFASLKRSR